MIKNSKSNSVPKTWKKRVYCVHGICNSNTKNAEPGVLLIPFLKPCASFYKQIINPTDTLHSEKTCFQCSRVLKWIHLCKRADKKLSLYDISPKTYICSKHFYSASGPTEENPDPFPADKPEHVVAHARRTSRKRLTARVLIPQKKKKRDEQTTELIQPPITSESISTKADYIVNEKEGYSPEAEFTPVFNDSVQFIEHNYFLPDGHKSKKTPFENVAIQIFQQNLTVKYDHESIHVEIHDSLTVEILNSLSMKLFAYGTEIPFTHEIWSNIPQKIEVDKNYMNDLKALDHWNICTTFKRAQIATQFQKEFNANFSETDDAKTVIDLKEKCLILCQQQVCKNCKQAVSLLRKRLARKAKREAMKPPVALNIKYMTKEEAHYCVRQSRYTLQLEKRKVARLRLRLRNLINDRGVHLNNSDSGDFLYILSHGKKEVEGKGTDLTRLFFQEQLKAAKVKNPKGHRWHPLILKWCLYLKTKSSSTYAALRKVITLPSEKRLFKIQALTHIKPGFQADVLAEIVREFDSAGPEPHKRFCSLLYDEMKIKEDLVYKATTNEIIGFVQLSDVSQLLTEIDSEASGTKLHQKPFATHALQLMIRGITTSILTTFAYFATKSLTAGDLFPIMWDAVDILESNNIKVLAFVSDGAAANRSFYKICQTINGGDNWYVVNPYDKSRNIFFVCDVPHLLKTVRNCFSNSGCHKNTRLLWKNSHHIEWRHIIDAYNNDFSDGIRKLYHISDEHIHLNPCSLMKVKLAAQVLSRRMAIALEDLNSEAVSETIIFVETFNKWFDILNTRNTKEGIFKKNPNLYPYTQPDDARLLWLEGSFIEYLDAWEKEVHERPGNFTKSHRSKMLLSQATVEGLKITAHSVVDMVRFILAQGAQFILTNKFNQDPVELEFSKQRGASGCNTNPSLMRYGDNTAKLKSMRIVRQDIAFAGNGNITH